MPPAGPASPATPGTTGFPGTPGGGFTPTGGTGAPGAAPPAPGFGGAPPSYPPPSYPGARPPGWRGPAPGAGVGGRRGGLPPIVTIILVFIGGLVGIVLVGGLLAFTGAPTACAARSVQPTAAASQELRTNWNNLKARGGPGTFTELQATSRGVEYINEKGAPVDDLQVYFCPGGYAEASGKVSILGLKSKVVVRGTLDVSGSQPQIVIQEVRAGNLPSAVAKPVVDAILNTGNLKTLDLGARIAPLQFSDGVVTVTVVR
jgi:hypothetical protein